MLLTYHCNVRIFFESFSHFGKLIINIIIPNIDDTRFVDSRRHFYFYGLDDTLYISMLLFIYTLTSVLKKSNKI